MDTKDYYFVRFDSSHEDRSKNCSLADLVSVSCMNVFAQLSYIIYLIKFVMATYIHYFTPIHKIWWVSQPSFSMRCFSTHFHWDIHIIDLKYLFVYKNNFHNRIFSNERDLNSLLKRRSKLYERNDEKSCLVNHLNNFQKTCGFNSEIYVCLNYDKAVLFYFNLTSCSKYNTVSFIVYKIMIKSSTFSNQLR